LIMPYARAVYSKGDPAMLDSGIAYFRRKVVSTARSAPGYVAAELKVNRATGESVALTGWETLEALNSSEEMAQETQRQAQEATGAVVLDIDRMDLFFRHGSGKPLALPSFVRWSEGYADLDNMDQAIEFAKTTVKGSVSAQPGFAALNCGVNRMTGRFWVVTSWESASARAASSQTAATVPHESTPIARAKHVRLIELEVVFFHGRTASGEFFEVEQPAVAG
jgi:heme-degrading monooxygenase HmoA